MEKQRDKDEEEVIRKIFITFKILIYFKALSQ